MDSSRIGILTSELAAQVPLRDIEVTIGARTFRLTTAEDIEDLIERISEEEFRKDERLPYWAELWHSAVALADFLTDHPTRLQNARVLEIGCGLALPSIVAASLGAHVRCADYEPMALKAAEINILRNVPDAGVDLQLMDFRSPPDQRWPLILGADIIYERRFIEALANFLLQVLEPGGSILLAEPNRLIAVPFFEALTTLGFSCTRQTRMAELYQRSVEISIYEITR
ncbi:MAG: 50S ribosomal protein L11 methyltransferase [Bacteroidetes bacterium]|nr:50S ribosomal protein L11 methyltransferase [Bacteroidota bacterium]